MGLKSAQHCCKASAILCGAPALRVCCWPVPSSMKDEVALAKHRDLVVSLHTKLGVIDGHGLSRCDWEKKESVLLGIVSIWWCQWAQPQVTNKLHCAKGWTELLRKNRRAVLAYFCDSIRHTLSEPHCSSVCKPWHGQSEWLGWIPRFPERECIFSTQLVVFREVCRCFVLSWKTKGFAPSQEGKTLPLGNLCPAASCQWAVKVNTRPLSLQAALCHCWVLWCFMLTESMRLSIWGPQWKKMCIHFPHLPLPLLLFFFFSPPSKIHVQAVFGLQNTGYTCVKWLLGGPWVSSTCRCCCVPPLLVAWKSSNVFLCLWAL